MDSSQTLPTEANDINKLMIFKSNGVLFSLPLKTVLEIQGDLKLLELPFLESGIVGAVEYRGMLLPVLDICTALNLKTKQSQIPKSYILVEFHSWSMAFQIDEFYKIIDDIVIEEKNNSENYSIANQFISGITILDKNSLIILNIKEIINYFTSKLKQQISLSSKEITQKNILLKGKNTETIKSLCFNIENVQFMVPIQYVQEVLENQTVTPLFRVNPCLRGLINLRGRVVACLDISSFLGLSPRNLNEYTQFILLGYEDFEIALCVDCITKMKVFPNSQLQSNIDSLPNSIKEYTSGILQVQRETLLMISAKDLIFSKELLPYWNLRNL